LLRTSATSPQLSSYGTDEEGEDGVNSNSIISGKGKTRKILDNWLKTRRPDAVELKEKGILSTDGNVDNIKIKKGKSAKLGGGKQKIIGMELLDLLAAVPGRPIPLIVDQCITYIRRNAMKLNGVFRVSPNQQELQKLQKSFKSPNEVVDMTKKVKDPHVVAGLLKLFFSSLPEPIFPFSSYTPLMDAHEAHCANEDPAGLIGEYRRIVESLPPERTPIVKFLFDFLYELQSYSDTNMMTPSNLGIVFGPNLIKPKNATQTTMLNMSNRDIVTFMIAHYKEIF